jgi:membrane protein DedA with SNARE-associated domain
MSPGLLTALILKYRYVILVPGAMTIGPLVSLVAGALIRFGTLDLAPTAACLMGAELFGDILWYWAGVHFGDSFVSRFGRFVGITAQRVASVKRLYHTHHDTIILVSKLTAGFGIAPAIFFTAGLSRVPFKRYMMLNVVGQIVWTSTMLAIGYFLGHYYLAFNSTLDRIFLIGTTLLVLAALFGFGRFLLNRASEND